jgi:hypothetical protein
MPGLGLREGELLETWARTPSARGTGPGVRTGFGCGIERRPTCMPRNGQRSTRDVCRARLDARVGATVPHLRNRRHTSLRDRRHTSTDPYKAFGTQGFWQTDLESIVGGVCVGPVGERAGRSLLNVPPMLLGPLPSGSLCGLNSSRTPLEGPRSAFQSG